MRQFAKGFSCLLLLQLWSAFSSYASSQPCAPTVTTSGDLCSTGQVNLTASPAATYLWSTGATTQSIAVTKEGSYTVTTKQEDGCEGTSEEVTVTDGPDATVVDPISFFTSCSYAGNVATFELTIENASVTKETNTRYEINWGDGNTTTLGPEFETDRKSVV